MAVFGYARVSTVDQNLDSQKDALVKYGCEKIYYEKASGKNIERPQLKKMLESIREKDVVVVYKLDRLARSLKDLINLVNLLASKKVDFVSISDGIDTSTAVEKLMFHLVGAFAEFERDIISERTKVVCKVLEQEGEKEGSQKDFQPKRKRKLQEQKSCMTNAT